MEALSTRKPSVHRRYVLLTAGAIGAVLVVYLAVSATLEAVWGIKAPLVSWPF